MTFEPHTHLEPMPCRDYKGCADGPRPDMFVPMGPITGMRGVATELLLHLGYQPAEHPDALHELEQAIGEEMLDVGRQVLAEHGLPVRVD
jgi:hypothetical protein